MNLELNKNITKQFFEFINSKEFQKAFDLLDESLSWWIIGKTKLSGTNDKRGVSTGFKMLHRIFEGFHFIFHEFTAEEDRVSLTAESKGKHKNGKDYNNQYHFLIWIKDGKIIKVKEYFDTEHAIWIDSP